VGSNPTNGYCVPTPTQRAIPPGSVNEYQRKLGSKRVYHAMHWPRIRGLAASAGVRLRAKETEISAAPWALRGSGKDFTLLFMYVTHNNLSRCANEKSELVEQCSVFLLTTKEAIIRHIMFIRIQRIDTVTDSVEHDANHGAWRLPATA